MSKLRNRDFRLAVAGAFLVLALAMSFVAVPTADANHCCICASVDLCDCNRGFGWNDCTLVDGQCSPFGGMCSGG